MLPTPKAPLKQLLTNKVDMLANLGKYCIQQVKWHKYESTDIGQRGDPSLPACQGKVEEGLPKNFTTF